MLEPIIKEAGKILLGYFGHRLERTYKENGRHGFVTKADLASEQFLKDSLHRIMPEASFIAEESGASGGNNDYRWVIDPLDGTTNFTCGLPYFCISVALTYQDVPQVAAVYYPLLDEFFYAEQGKGALLNGKKISVSSPESLKRAVIGVGIPDPWHERPYIINIAQQVAKQVQAIRHLGAAALDLANVAAGRLDGIVFSKLEWWDVAAGILLVQEAGGMVTDFSKQPMKPGYTSCVAGQKQVWQELLAIVTPNTI